MEECILIPVNIVEESLNQEPVVGKSSLEPLRTFCKEKRIPLRAVADFQSVSRAEWHKHHHDLWHCFEGEGVFICGGEMINPAFKLDSKGQTDKNELEADGIVGGREYPIKAGEWLWIPAGVPHLHQSKGGARYFVVKMLAKP